MRWILITVTMLLASCQKKEPTGIKVESAMIVREGDKVVCRVLLVNPGADSSDRVSLSFASTVTASAIYTTLEFPSGSVGSMQSYSGCVIEGFGPGEMTLSFRGESIPQEEDLSQGTLGLAFVSYKTNDGSGRDFEELLSFDVTFDAPQPDEQ